MWRDPRGAWDDPAPRRPVTHAVRPMLSGYLLGLSSFGWPLVICGGLKAVYDLLLLGMFRAVRPPEEAAG